MLEISRNAAFYRTFVPRWLQTVGSLKRRARRLCRRSRGKMCTRPVARSAFASQNRKNPQASEHFWTARCGKFVPRFGVGTFFVALKWVSQDRQHHHHDHHHDDHHHRHRHHHHHRHHHVSKSVSETVSQSFSQSVSQSVIQSLSDSVKQSASQSVIQSRLVSVSVSQSVSQFVSQCVSHFVI